MPSRNPLADVICNTNHIDDIAAANAWGKDMGLSDDELPGTIINWFAAIDPDKVQRRSQTIRKLSVPGSPFEYLFNDDSFGDLKGSWTTGDATAFLDYCGDGTSNGLWRYLLALKETAGNHVGAIDDYLDRLDTLLDGVNNAFNDHIEGFESKNLWADVKVLFSLSNPYEQIENFVYAVAAEAEQFGADVTSLGDYEALMQSSWMPTVGGKPYEGDSRGPDFTEGLEWEDHEYGPTSTYPLDGEGERTEEEISGGGG